MCKLGAVMHSREKSLIISLVGVIKREREICFRRNCKFSQCSLLTLLTLLINLDSKPFARYAGLYFKNEYCICVQKLNFALDKFPEKFCAFVLNGLPFSLAFPRSLSSGLDSEIICQVSYGR